jgi:fatty acid desaturase
MDDKDDMAAYLDEVQRDELVRLRGSWLWRTDAPTWALILTIYGSWFAVVLHARQLGLPFTALLLAPLAAWYMSLQHELIHGHPTRHAWLNALLGAAPLAVWLPYALYRDAHLLHHNDDDLTCPWIDPESYFVTHADWQRAGSPMRALLALRNTFAGRLLIGPAMGIARVAGEAVREISRGGWRDLAGWAAHAAMLCALLWWLDARCGVPPWFYVGCVGYPALSLGAIRSFQEHRAVRPAAQRTVINEAAWPWRLLFLNNNYHLVHHDLPFVPWFALSRVYHRRRSAYRARNGGFVVTGYGQWLTRFALRQVAPPVHPFLSVPADAAVLSTQLDPPRPVADEDRACLTG